MRTCLRLLLAGVLLGSLSGGVLVADEAPITDAARKASIKKVGKQLRKKARSPHAPKHKEEILALLDALRVFGGVRAGIAGLEAVAFADGDVRDRAFLLAESHPDVALVKPFAAMLEAKEFRKDIDLRRRAARALSIVGNPAGMPALTALIRTDEDPEVVAAAADSLATFSSAPLKMRKEAVRRLIDTYTSTWNLMKSIRPEDRILSSKMKKQYKVYGRFLRVALQALTGEQALSRPQEWREWWNANKKRTNW